MSADFLDSNIFVCLFDETDERKRQIATRLVHRGLESGEATISYQVVQETLHVLTRKLPRRATADEAARFLTEVLQPFWRGSPTPTLYRRALDLQSRHSLSFYDALIVSAALEAGCTRLWTEDLEDGSKIDGLLVENPFAEGREATQPPKKRRRTRGR